MFLCAYVVALRNTIIKHDLNHPHLVYIFDARGILQTIQAH